jgi:hypothetical protein
MGVFGTGLYSGDFAMDLRSAISAVSRLPYDGDRLVEIIRQIEPSAADHPEDEDHTTFWLVLADQFAKRGIAASLPRERALEIIDRGLDLEMLKRLGMSERDLRKRKTVLEELRERLVAPLVEKPRVTLKKPQPYTMEVGDVVIYPTAKGENINPYYSKKAWEKLQASAKPWVQDGWGALTIIQYGRAFDFLTWYRPLVMVDSTPERPDIDAMHAAILWRLDSPGTCSESQFAKMKLEKIGSVKISASKVQQLFGELKPGRSAAISDISIANRMSAGPSFQKVWLLKPGEPRGKTNRMPTILGLDSICES